MPRILELAAVNYRSLADVTIPLGPLNVLVGPNESGKSNVLDVIQFLGDSARLDLRDALQERGGYNRVRFRGAGTTQRRRSINISVKAIVTSYASANAPDEYSLTFWETVFRSRRTQQERRGLIREEAFLFKRRQGRGRRIQIRGAGIRFADVSAAGDVEQASLDLLQSESLGLATLPRLAPEQGGDEVRRFANLFLGFQVVNPDVSRAAEPNSLAGSDRLRPDAANLSAFLFSLQHRDDAAFDSWLSDARLMIPGFRGVQFRSVGGADEAVVMEFVEQGVQSPTRLREASFGTIRMMALLAILNDPEPALITAIEEIDHGLHPYVFDHLADRLREASTRTQLILATHSPALVNRLRPSEIIVCERDFQTGASRIPAIDSEAVAAVAAMSEGQLGLGEIWFTGTLGGVPE